MKINKLLFLFLIFIVSSIKGKSQTLTIQETVDYINKLFFECAAIEKVRPRQFQQNWLKDRMDSGRHVYAGCDVITQYVISIENDGIIALNEYRTTTNCDDSKNNYYNMFDHKSKFNIVDIDLNSWEIYKEPKSRSDYGADLEKIDYFGYYTKEYKGYISFDCINKDEKCIYHYNENNEIRMNEGLKIWIFSDHIKNDLERFSNALLYLIQSAKEKGYKPKNIYENDPFISHDIVNTQSNKSSKSIIPLKKEGGVFTLSVTLGNIIKSQFILDSGAGDCSISTELENKLKANGLIKEKDYLPNALYRIADGSVSICKRVKIPKIIVGGKIIYNLVTSIGPSGSPNLLGQSFLSKTNKWSIDNSTNQLIIE